MRTANRLTHKARRAKKPRTSSGVRSFFTKKEMPAKVLILDPDEIESFIQDRRDSGIDRYDEVWEGVYVVPPLANLPHQDLATALAGILFNVITLEERGRVQGGANISDRRAGWKRNFRCPDVVVVLKEGRAADCHTHWLEGPDFLIEVQSPGDETEEKIPFYSQIRVRELLIIHRDTRQLRLYRHDGQRLVPVRPTEYGGGKWLMSAVVPLAFRRRMLRRTPFIEVQRTDGIPGNWTV